MSNGDKPANPVSMDDGRVVETFFGITKREYFAIMVMQGVLSAQEKIV
jgi:hypothetical protein